MVQKPNFDEPTELVDVETEDVIYRGQPLTDERAEEIAEHALAARRSNLTPGGKSLSGGGKHSPVVQVRLPEDVRDELAALASDAGVSVSKYARELLVSALRHH